MFILLYNRDIFVLPGIAFDCNGYGVSYDKVKIFDYIYVHHCFPSRWDEFLKNVKNIIENEVSPVIYRDARRGYRIEPPMPLMFKAFTVKPDAIRAVVMGPEPYPEEDRATGLAFSIKPEEDPRNVPSVFNLITQLKLEGVCVSLSNGDLTPWLSQGVFLLNAALTVQQGTPGSHIEIWKKFKEQLLQFISQEAPFSAWILLGERLTTGLIDTTKHIVRQGAHPSSSNFFRENYFGCVNPFLQNKDREPIVWRIEHRPGITNDMEPCRDHGECIFEESAYSNFFKNSPKPFPKKD